MYGGVHTDERASRLYSVVFCIRRLTLVTLMLTLPKYPYFKIQGFFMVQTFYYMYIGWVRPHILKAFNRLEIINEFLLIIFGYTMFLSTSYVDIETSYNMGWVTIGIIVLILVINFGYLFHVMYTGIKFYLNVRKYEQKHGVVPPFLYKIRNKAKIDEELSKNFVNPFEPTESAGAAIPKVPKLKMGKQLSVIPEERDPPRI